MEIISGLGREWFYKQLDVCWQKMKSKALRQKKTTKTNHNKTSFVLIHQYWRGMRRWSMCTRKSEFWLDLFTTSWWTETANLKTALVGTISQVVLPVANLIFSNGHFLIQDQDINLKERVWENGPNHNHWILKAWNELKMKTEGMHRGLDSHTHRTKNSN